MAYLRSRLLAAGVVVAVLGLLAFGGVQIRAQGTAGTPTTAAPVATVAPAAAEPAHPAHIHEGTCSNINPNPEYPLADVSYENLGGSAAASPVGGTPAAAGANTVGVAAAIPAEGSVTQVKVSLQHLLATAHAINVHESATDITHYIACGDIGGILNGKDLVFGIHELNDSGLVGTAWLHDNGDGTTTVTLFLAHGLIGSFTSSPNVPASPAAVVASPAVAAPVATAPAASPMASPGA